MSCWNIGHLVRLRFHYSLLIILLASFVPMSQIVYYINHKGKIQPTFLKLFQVMSSSQDECVLDLHQDELIALTNLSRKYFTILKFNCDYGITSSCFSIILALYTINTSLSTTLAYGLPAAIHLGFSGNVFLNMLGYQCLYFYMVCKYLRMKFKALKLQLISSRNKKQTRSVMKIIRSFTSIASEIQDYDDSYFSKFLFNFWFVYSLAIVLLLNIVIFGGLSLSIKCVLAYILIIYFAIFLFTIMTAASINYHAKKMYSPLNSLYVTISIQNIDSLLLIKVSAWLLY